LLFTHILAYYDDHTCKYYAFSFDTTTGHNVVVGTTTNSVAIAISDIAGATEDGTSITPGSGDAYLYELESSSPVILRKVTPNTVTVYNMSSGAICADVPLIISKVYDKWFVVVESCGEL
jgi:hypothetical protein